jgi:hypothetical protein
MEFETDYFSKMPSRRKNTSRWTAPTLSDFVMPDMSKAFKLPSATAEVVVPDKDIKDVEGGDDGLPEIVNLNTGLDQDDPNKLTLNNDNNDDDDDDDELFKKKEKTPEQIETERQLAAEKAEKNRLLAKNQTLEAANKRSVESATAILTKFVNLFGLPLTVVQKLKAFMTAGLTSEEIELEIQDTEEYKARFPGMATRLANGFGSMTPVEYIEFEDGQKELMRLNGMPAKFYDEPEDFTTFIGQDVSLSELSSRVDMARLATQGADSNTKAELKRLFGINDDDLVAYYLDPKKATNLFEEKRALEAAGLSATAITSLNNTVAGFDKETASSLQRESIQGREIQQRLTPQAGLTEAVMGEKQGLTSSELAKAEFGLSAEAKTKVKRTREERATGFEGSGGALMSGAGVSGLGRAL